VVHRLAEQAVVEVVRQLLEDQLHLMVEALEQSALAELRELLEAQILAAVAVAEVVGTVVAAQAALASSS
jgi:hypothetical protein